jgi:hypothetical protein
MSEHRAAQEAQQVDALAEIINAILVARGFNHPIELATCLDWASFPEAHARQLRDHARRALAERDPIKVGVAHYRGHQALCATVEELFLGGVRRLTPAQRDAYRIAFHRALTAYQASLEGYLGEPKADELAAVATPNGGAS